MKYFERLVYFFAWKTISIFDISNESIYNFIWNWIE